MPKYLKQNPDTNGMCCAPPINLGDLCCDRKSCCPGDTSVDNINLEAWIDHIQNGTELAPDAYTLDELLILEEWQQYLDDAWQVVNRHTCNRFAGGCFVVRLCAPYCPPCPPCTKCRVPACFDLSDIVCDVPLAEVESACFLTYNEDGTTSSVPVDLPHGQLVPGAQWRLSHSDGQLDLCPQRLAKDADLPGLPENDISLAFGSPCTSGLVFTMKTKVPAEVKVATRELACWLADQCHKGRCTRVGDAVESVSNNGVTVNFDRPDLDQINAGSTGVRSLDVAAYKFGCKAREQIISPCEPDSIVYDVRHLCQCPDKG